MPSTRGVGGRALGCGGQYGGRYRHSRACAGGWPSVRRLPRRPRCRARGPPRSTARYAARGPGRVSGGVRQSLARTRGSRTAETADVQAEAQWVVHDGEVAQLARVVAMHVRRRGVTVRAAAAGVLARASRRSVGSSVETSSTTKPGNRKGSRDIAERYLTSRRRRYRGCCLQIYLLDSYLGTQHGRCGRTTFMWPGALSPPPYSLTSPPAPLLPPGRCPALRLRLPTAGAARLEAVGSRPWVDEVWYRRTPRGPTHFLRPGTRHAPTRAESETPPRHTSRVPSSSLRVPGRVAPRRAHQGGRRRVRR